MSFEIRKAVSNNDFTDIADNAKIIWNEHYGDILSKEQIDYMLKKFQSFESIKNQVEKEGYEYYILYDGCFLGYIAVKPNVYTLFLSKLYILREHRRKGYSKKAMSFLIERAKEIEADKISLTVNKENLLSIEVYKRLGFKTAGQKKSDIGGGFYMDDYIMEFEVS